MRSGRLVMSGLLVLGLSLAGCSGDDEPAITTATPLPTTVPPTTAPSPTAPSPTAPPATAPPTTVASNRAARLAGGSTTYYANCTEARQAGAAPLRRGEPGYGGHLDRDDDGVACE